MITKELERAGIPTAQVAAMSQVALMGGSGAPRVVQGMEIVSPLGNARMDSQTERKLRQEIVENALKALQTDVKDSTLFERRKSE